MKAASQRVGIWVLVLALYWLAGAALWPRLSGGEGGVEEPAVWIDEEYGVVCYLWRDRMQCIYLPDFEASVEEGWHLALMKG